MSIVANVLFDWKISFIGFCLLAFTSIINTKIAILPVSCLTFVICSVFVWFISMCLTFVGLHKLLQKNEPLELSLRRFSAKQKILKKQKNELKSNPDRVKALTNDVDKYFIDKWYSNISEDDGFTEESKLFLEEVINRSAEVQLSVNNKVLLHGILNIYLKHLKEYRRSLKRKERYNGSIEDLYRYSHICSSSPKTKDYFIHQLTTNLLRHFINSELWNSLPCHVLVSILARKLILHILNLSANPEILNYIFLNLIASNGVKEKYNMAKYTRISLTQYYDVKDSAPEQPKPVDNPPDDSSNEKTDLIAKHMEGIDTVDALKVSENREAKIELKSEVIPKKDKPFQGRSPKKDDFLSVENKESRRNPLKKKIDLVEEPKEKPVEEQRPRTDPVKIYEPKSRNTRTWHDSKDILGISLGQDPLDVFQAPSETGKTLGRSAFWDTVRAEHSSDGSPPTAANILLNEMKHTTHTTMEGLKSSIKPISDATVHTLHNIKDLQESTVNNALNKIGDFQDEAAGMVEGILDFGRAGFRKGLRLTGLQDNIENAKATLHISSNTSKPQPKKKPTKLARSESPDKTNSEDSSESVWINPIQADSPNYDGQILLEKLKKSEEKNVKPKEGLQIPFISTEQPEIGTDSPDPEYEDTADLASSIAKLRSLLQQKSSESSLSTPALSPMPPDEFLAKPAETENISDVDDVDGVMPSFYKFCAKTATGVFDKTINTIKTALPGNIQVEQSDNAWIFIQSDETEAEILTRMNKLLTERKEYCTLDTEIDTAYEAIDSLDAFQQSGSAMFPSQLEFEDELDDFEAKLPITKALLDIMCELLADTNSPFLQEPLVKVILLSLGNTIEEFMISKVDELMQSLCTDLITIPSSNEMDTLSLEMDTYIEAFLSSIPDPVKVTIGKSTLVKSLTLFVSSIQSQIINQDVILQIFELIAMKLIEESTQLSPPASA